MISTIRVGEMRMIAEGPAQTYIFRHPELVSGSISPPAAAVQEAKWMLEAKLCLHKRVQHDEIGTSTP
jgi:hypothetical protein